MGATRFAGSKPMRDTPQSLEPSPQEIRRLLDAAASRIGREASRLADRRASDVEGGAAVAASVREDWPPRTADLEEILDLLFDRLAPKSFNTTSPGFMAYVPGGGLFHAALADLIAETINRYTTVWAAAPGLVQLEVNVIRWLAALVGFPEGAGGFLASGGSMATFSAVVAARRDRLPEDFLRGTIYVSGEVHHSVDKAAMLAGFPAGNVRRIPVDGSFRMRVEDLERAIGEDRSAGFEPFLLVASAGTTNTGAVDPLEELAAVAARRRLWLHVDGAYGGFFQLTERGRRALRGIEQADSITLDPHKGLFLPYGTGCLLVRDVEKLRRAHQVDADYMPPMQEDPDRLDFCALSPELSREFRGLRVWLPFKLLGVEPFRAALDEKLDLAEWAAAALRTVEGVELVAAPQLSTLAFRMVRPGLDQKDLNRLNRRLLEAINAAGRVFLTPTVLDGRFVIRICVLQYRTHRDRMEMLLEDLRTAVARLAAEP